MPTQATIQSKIWLGYGKAAKVLGTPYSFYHQIIPSYMLTSDGHRMQLVDGSGDMVESGSLIPGSSPLLGTAYQSVNVSLNAEDMKYQRPNKWGKPSWYALFDATGAKAGDYFVGAQGTFFVAGLQPLLPILAVECNRSVTVLRSQVITQVGASSYSGKTETNEISLMENWPCSILQGPKGEKDEVNLPGDTRSPWWVVLLPYYSGCRIKTSDVLEDDIGRRLTCSSVEQTDLGYKITAQQATS